MPFRFSFLVLAGTLACVPGLSAQTRDSTRLPDIVVTATRGPTPRSNVGSSVDLLRPAELVSRQLTSLREALQLVPGGTVLVNGAPGGTASIFLRGVSSSQTLFLVDGIRVNDANTSSGSLLGGADLAGLGTLEIVRGPESTLYGGAAIGGVVALDAARGAGPARGSVELEGGSFDSWRGRAMASGGWGKVGATAAFSANGTDNQRRPNDWDQRTQLLRLDYQISAAVHVGGTFRGLQQGFTSPGDLRTTNTTPVGKTTFEDNLATLFIEVRPATRWLSRLVAGAQEEFTKGADRFDGGPEFVFTLTNTRRVIDWQNTLQLGGIRMVAGVNREWSTAWTSGTSQDERLFGVYGQAEFTPISSITLSAGLRNDNYNTFGHTTTFRVSGAWRPIAGLKLRASLGSGFMPPSLSARFGSAFQGPNPDIRPERSRGWDAGVDREWAGGRGTVSLTYFHNSLRDLIGFENAPFPALGRNINIERARTSGLEASGRVHAGMVDARFAYTLLSARSLSASDPNEDRLIRRPRHALSADLGVAPTRRSEAGVGLIVVADRQDTDFNSFPSARVDPGDYAVARVYGSYDLTTRLTLRARVENLFDARYEPVYGFPALGRALRASVEMRF